MKKCFDVIFGIVLSKTFLFGIALFIGIGSGYFAKSHLQFNTTRVMATKVEKNDHVTQTKSPVTSDAVVESPAPPTVVEQPIAPPGNPVVETNEKSNKSATGFYSDDEKRIGDWKFFYDDGNIKSAGGFVDDVRVGFWRFYHPNGTVMSEGKYGSNGKLTGLWVSYYPNGARKCEGAYTNNIRTGQWLNWPYESNPDFYWQGAYDNGRRQGDWKWYSTGTVRMVETYQQGQVIQQRYFNGGLIHPPTASSK